MRGEELRVLGALSETGARGDVGHLREEGWSDESVSCYLRFGERRVALLYPLVKRENAVRTPRGLGTLHQAFGTYCLVVHARERKMLDAGTKRARPVMRYVATKEVRPA